MIKSIKGESLLDGEYSQKLFEENLLKRIAKTRQDIIDQVVKDSKKINDLKFSE